MAFLLAFWAKHRDTFVEQLPADLFSGGRSGGWRARSANQSESAVEQGLIREVLAQVFHFEIANNQTFKMNPTVASELSNKAGNNRPDMVLFDRAEKHQGAMSRLAHDTDGGRFCKEATFILDAKKFQKPIGADATMADIDQVERYLRGYDTPWGILSNGRDWRLIQQGDRLSHLTFHLVDLLEDILVHREGVPSEDDVQAFRVFYQVFGPQSRAVLHDLTHATEAEERHVRQVLQDNAHNAVELLALGFWSKKANAAVAGSLEQAALDQLREFSLIFLYRLLFLFKAEAQGLLPVSDENGAPTPYGDNLSTAMIFQVIQGGSESGRPLRMDGFHRLKSLFAAVNAGHDDLHIPAYNGGLFEPHKHQQLDAFELDDATLYDVFAQLIFLDQAANKPVPYADLDVRDLGDIYEGLLEQRLVAKYKGGAPYLELVNQKGERKASGSYFTPDRLAEHLVRQTVEPLLLALPGESNEAQVKRILSLKVVDPSMGSGHFLVKVIDVMALWLTLHCDPLEADAPADSGAKELMYWKAQVAEHCVYGVDYNPMSVELAKVAVWLHTARRDKPLTFLDHHLKVGNSLVGANLKSLTDAGLAYKTAKSGDGGKWVAPAFETPPELGGKSKTPKQPGLPFELDHNLLTQVLGSIQTILDRPANEAAEVKQKEKDYFEAVGTRLEAFKLLADLWCAQWFVAEPTAANAHQWNSPGGLYDKVKDVCHIPDDAGRTAALRSLDGEPLVVRLRSLVESGFGPRRFAFFHWELEFPEVFFAIDGATRPNAGFDAVVGNPPWDKLKPATKDFYSPWSPEVANTQGKSLDRLVEALDKQYPLLVQGWTDYQTGIENLVWYLSASGAYRYQTMEVDGKKTGGDPDLFRYFVERSVHLTAPGRRVGLVVPGTLWQGAGTSALRVLLLKTNRTERLEVYENYRKWAFDIDTRFKFTTFVAQRQPGAVGGSEPITCAFMLRSAAYLDGREPHRRVELSLTQIEALSPGNRSLLDFRSGAEALLAARIYAQPGVARFNAPETGMMATYSRELDMTNDAKLFKSPEWMRQRGFSLVTAVRNADGSAGQCIDSG
ncbi:MAG: N-6 DNA methylase [Spirochaetales bacterium]